MPIYEYVCQSCGKEFEEMQRFSDAPLEQCLFCEEKAPVQRKVSKSAFLSRADGTRTAMVALSQRVPVIAAVSPRRATVVVKRKPTAEQNPKK